MGLFFYTIFMDIGFKIKELRLQNELTQEELADRCELTKGYISQLENDLTSPSILTLKEILSTLGSNLSDFFDELDDEEHIVFDKSEFVEKIEDDLTIEWITPSNQKNVMESICVTLKPHSSTDQDRPHSGEEFGYILQGNGILVFGKKRYKIKQGQTFYFKANKVHWIANDSNETLKIIWVSSPPNF